MREDVQQMFEVLELPVSRRNLARRLFEVLDVEGSGHLEIDTFMERTLRLKAEGRGLERDKTLLLMELRHLGRRLNRLEGALLPVQAAAIPGLTVTPPRSGANND